MENCLAAAALNGLDRRSLQRSAKLERRKTSNPQCFLQNNGRIHGLYFESVWEVLLICARGRRGNPCLSLSQREVIGAVLGHRERSEKRRVPRGRRHLPGVGLCSGGAPACECRASRVLGFTPTACYQAENISKDLYIEVYPGTYSVTVGTNDLTKKTHVVAVDSGQSVDLVFPV
ncbi:A-kinase-interacting protein 1 isoform X3 [Camelus bactrianus]|uniref:A-kinase-interacting protein 1 isoform X3 n=1 Tax=Camelus bactrianus TaxID=9837 RepID=A0AC58R1W9_CAMBA